MKIYTATALAEASGATYRQVHYWTEQGALKTLEIEGSLKNGTGQRRFYDAAEVEVARRLKVLTTRDVESWADDIRRALDGRPSPLPFGLSLIKTPTAGGA